MCMVYAEFLIFIREQIFLYHTRFMDGSVRHTSLSLPAERWESDTCIPLLHLKDVGMSLFEINFHDLYWLCPCINKNICFNFYYKFIDKKFWIWSSTGFCWVFPCGSWNDFMAISFVRGNGVCKCLH